MRSEYTRQTRWANPPDPVDSHRFPPGAPYLKQLVWMPCNQCDLQVHAGVTQLLSRGVACPECGRGLSEPMEPETAPEAVASVRQFEQQLSQELAGEET